MLGSSTMQVAVIDVRGMKGQPCAQIVQKTLTAMDGVTHSRIDLSRNEVHVTYDGEAVTISRLFRAITAAGFSPEGFTRGPAREND
jgi:copper chaperone CopZ